MKGYIFILQLCLFAMSCMNNNQNEKAEQGHINTEKEKPTATEHPVIAFLNERDSTNTTGLPVVDLQKMYSFENVCLQDIADVEYIVLETHDDALITTKRTIVTDSFIVTRRMEDAVFFKRDGRFSHVLNRKGGSGEEYTLLSHLCISPQNREVYIHDGLRGWIQVYTYNGEYKRTLKIKDQNFTLGEISYNGSEALFAEDIMNVDYVDNKPTNPRPYYNISVADGTKYRLPIILKKRIGNAFKMFDEKTGINTTIRVDLYPVSNINNELIISNFALDTIYKYQNEKLVPIARKENWKKQNGVPNIVALDAMTEDFFLWHAVEKDFDNAFKGLLTRTILQNRHTGKCLLVNLVDSNIIDKRFRFPKRMTANYHITPENTILQYYPADVLKELLGLGKLQGKLKEIASKLDEEDNPVLVLAKFK